MGQVLAAGIVLVWCGNLLVQVHESRPHTRLAEAGSAEIDRVVDVGEAELFILTAEQADCAGVGNHVAAIDHFHRGVHDLGYVLCGDGGLAVLQREGGDARLVGMSGDVSVRDAAGHPYRAFCPILDIHVALFVQHLFAFAHHFEDPHLVGVGD